MRPIIFALLTAFFWGLAPIFGKMGLTKLPPLAALFIRTFSISIAVGICLLVSYMGGYLPAFTLDKRTLIFIVLEGILASFLGHFAYFYALKEGNVSLVVPLSATYPLFALLFGILFLKESLALNKIVGALIVILGIIVMRL
ncbi:EamA family transporter [Thermovenabulum gondwanense]|uniref:EamA domain-containing protein n=1 Tax=Thermovenabulum gondwanense TaxID=520767 RepID=A0A162MIG9_9FIRM|nr:EamA family transporter [Thermovenabulum gondwanense]KYO66146.1 hypothetical protein ATZ99_13380 [Thermovenabulum gondwanense]